MDLTIIIPSYNTSALLEQCLMSVYVSLSKDQKITYEVIVVDNASTDNSVSMIEKSFSNVKLIKNKTNLGFGKANNQAIKQAKGKYILLLNSDIKVIDNSIFSLYSYIKDRDHIFAGGKLLNPNLSSQSSAGPFFSLPIIFLMLFTKGDKIGISRYSSEKIKQVDWISGACIIGQKSGFIDVGMFDESIFMYMEEIEFFVRAKHKGYLVNIYPEAKFIHYGAASSGSKVTPVLNIFKGLLYFYRNNKTSYQYGILRLMLKIKALFAIYIGKIFQKKHLITIYEEANQYLDSTVK